MSESFRRAMEGVFLSEGGYTDNPNDPGGATRHGVSLRFLKSIYRTHKDWYAMAMGELNPPTSRTVYYLDRSTAFKIGSKFFWVPCKCGSMPTDIAYAVFDFAYNAGVSQSIKTLQRALNDLTERRDAALIIDGQAGPNTIRALNYELQFNGDDRLLGRLLFHRQKFYKSLAHRSRRYATFLRGWMRRAVHATRDTPDLPSEK